MKVTQEYEKTKTVEYFGNKLNVPTDTKYIATDVNGEVWAYLIKPTEGVHTWTQDRFDLIDFVGHADLEGMDWKDTLMEV